MIQSFYTALATTWGPQHWWPAETRFEVIAGAYLTQNTAWTNVERALNNLRTARALVVGAIRVMAVTELETLIRPAGYFRQKAQRLKSFVAHLDAHYEGSLDSFLARPTAELRAELLSLNGIGPETADSILLYAAGHPVFVVDAYTRRLALRHGIADERAGYEELRARFEQALAAPDFVARAISRSATVAVPASAVTAFAGASHPPSPVSTAPRSPLAHVYGEMHALIVGVGKHHCFKAEPDCAGCPLQPFLSRRWQVQKL